jgi:hypothetical protein
MRSSLLIVLACLVVGCAGKDPGATGGGADAAVASAGGAGSGGSVGAGGWTSGTGGGAPSGSGGGLGAGGAVPGSGGASAGSGGLTGGGGAGASTGGVATGGRVSGSGGTADGTGGAIGGAGGRTGAGGSLVGSGGTVSSTGGVTGAGGARPGTGGAVSGTGGAVTGGTATGGTATGGGGAGTGGSPGAGGATAAPTFAVEFTKADQSKFYDRADNGGSVAFGVASTGAGDNNVTELVFKGDPNLGPSDKLTPDYATEVGTNDGTFHYGTYRTRVQLARCGPSEELVNGIFTYFNDGKDHDGDGMIDNSEIDIEILCSDPSIISLTIWTESGASGSRNAARVIHTKTGAYEDTLNDRTSLGSGTNPDFKQTFPDPNAFYEMGFEWHATSIRYFMVFGDKEVTLWTYTDPAYIPTLPASFLFNVWHSDNWWTGGTADYPAADAILRVDWFRYWKE